MHKTIDSNKGNGCQICSLKIDFVAVVMNDIKKMNIVFFLYPPILKWNVVKVVILLLLTPFKKQYVS